ncbi:MAG: hypothetical protein IBX40_07335 [Methanosarcinales archaeon]|nr:hypothetical protein [Methanosarcinales archaeon]
MDITVNKMFRTNLFIRTFRELFNVTPRREAGDPVGPLAIILRNYPLAIAKGGSKHKEFPDQTYFTHIVNGLVLGGRMLENELLNTFGTEEKLPNNIVEWVRLYFAAFTLHDINKLETNKTLIDTVNNEWNKYSVIVAPFLSSIGEPETWSDDLKYLILSTEEGTRDHANLLNTRRNRQELEKISNYMKFSDRIGSIKSTSSLQIYHEIKKIFEDFTKENGRNLHVVMFADVPQTMLRVKASISFSKALEKNERYIVLKTPDSIIFEGSPINQDIIDQSILDLNQSLVIDTESLVKLYPPSSNSIKSDFAKKVKVTSGVIDIFIDCWLGRLLFWSGKEWRQNHTDFSVIMRKYGVIFERKAESMEATYNLKVPEKTSDEESAENNNLRYLSKLIVANRVALELEILNSNDSRTDTWLLENNIQNSSEYIDTIQGKTLSAIAFAILDGLKEPGIAYNQIIEQIASKFEEKYPNKDNEDTRDFFTSIIYYGSSDIDLLTGVCNDNIDKKEMCLQCGAPSEIGLEASLVFGYGATSGTGRKVTKLKDDARFKGRICKWCELENRIRKDEFKEIKKEGIVIQAHLGDYLVPINIHDVIESLKTKDTDTIDKISGKAKFTKFGKSHQLDHHTVVFQENPGNRKEQFYFLFQLLETFINDTGIKVHITPLQGAPRIRPEQFSWENAPGWVKSLNMNSLRIDEIPRAIEELRFIRQIASLRKGSDDIPKVLAAITLHPMRIFSLIYSFANDGLGAKLFRIQEDINKFIKIYNKEVNEMRMNAIVGEACKIWNHAPESNNDHTWMIRTALDVLQRNESADREDKITRCAGRLLEIAARSDYFNKMQGTEACKSFSDNLVLLLEESFEKNGKVPASSWRKDIIAQFALMYNQQKWAEVMARKAEKENKIVDTSKSQEGI